ncbi:GL26202 [Drosophila persimilis]|uniref:RING-type E3 ubiquitin transferase n=1 Tax=Drosophila persimilis TaxID=7234 RepID=B4GJ20_DROPE|nr:GL26202 [Drosophila persimilis]
MSEFAAKVKKMGNQYKEEQELLTDAPEEYLDPIISSLMTDPVILPSSKVTVDRSTIARHLLSDQTDPFNREPLTMDKVKSNEALKLEIDQWIEGKRTGYSASRQTLEVLSAAEQQGLRRRSEGDAPSQKKQQQTQQTQAGAVGIGSTTANQQTNASSGSRRVSLGDSANTDKFCGSGSQLNGEPGLQIRCRNTKCEQSASHADAKKLYKSCHNCTHLYCSRECRRAHWEKHRKACLHSRASNLCRQVLATCKDDLDSQRHSLLARKRNISQGRGVVRVLFRNAKAAEGFIKNGFQCMGEASYYKPESKMLIYVAICVVSEAPGMGQAPVRRERQLVSRCTKLKLCKNVLAELEIQQQAMQHPLAVVAVPERTEILILTFNPGLRSVPGSRELILSNILDILSRRGVLLRKHYPEIYQRLQTYTEGQTDKFHPVTLHPRDSQMGQSFVCIIMPVHTDSEFIKLPSAADGGNRVNTIDVGSPAALAKLNDDELLTPTTPAS